MKTFTEISKADQIERWRQVLRVLVELTPHERAEHFRMNTWGEKTPCGAVGCAAAHCGLDPWFRRRGFALKFRKVGGVWMSNLLDTKSTFAPAVFFGARWHDTVFAQPRATYAQTLKNIRRHIQWLALEFRPKDLAS